MADQRKCECGHTNPVGTVLCEFCGKPVEENGDRAFPSMRYEGMARRSQTHNKTLVDHVWNFFSSVKIAIILIVITLIAAAVGTIFPQQRYIPVPVSGESGVAAFYKDTYGMLGEIYYLLGFHKLYSSWWFVTLLVMIGMSLVICSLDRIVPLYKALSKPRVNPHLSFLKGQRLRGECEPGSDFAADETLAQAAAILKKKGYRIYREGSTLLGEKARFSRWGPYVNHIGLILFLLGVLLRGLPGMYLDEFIWVREGQTVAVPETPYYLKNVEYKTEYYREDEFPEQLDLENRLIPKNFQTDAVLYVNENADLPGAEPKLREVKSGSITVNNPFVYEDLYLYQASNQEMQLAALNFTLIDKQAGNKELGRVKLDLYEPEQEQVVAEGITVRVISYFPDFYMDESGQPATRTSQPNNPMFAVEVRSAQDGAAEKMIYVSGRIIPESEGGRYTLQIEMPDFTDITGLMVRKDKMLPLIYFGSFVVMVGLVMGFYWQHRRIWLHLEQGRLYLAGHTNKNWFGLKREAEFLVEQLALPMSLVLDSKSKNSAAENKTKEEEKPT
ncbi:MAG: cytochrome c biogenesis protein ResB [Brevibacillus sp.]|nr:cytochrome c biogenesis protein ResB [Brevibacillus sp.]